MKIVFKKYQELNIEQHKILLDIRNSKEVREMSKDSKDISLSEHLSWVEKLDESKSYFGVFADGVLTGGINYFKKQDEKYYWGLFFAKGTKPLIPLVVAYLFLERFFESLGLKDIYSEVMIENESAYKLSINLGMSIINQDSNYYFLRLNQKQWRQNKQTRFMKMILKRVDQIKMEFI